MTEATGAAARLVKPWYRHADSQLNLLVPQLRTWRQAAQPDHEPHGELTTKSAASQH